MEGVPRLPMLKVEMKDNHDYSNMDWMDASAESMREELQEQIAEQIRKHISENYSDDPQKYDDCINKFLELQTSAYKVIGNPDFEGSNTLKKYYGQLHYMQSRFKFTGENSLNCPFVWLDAFTGAYSQHNTFVFEQASIIFNLGACHSFLGAVDNRTSEEGTKVSCVHFQCAAGFFQFLADRLDTTLSPDTSQFMLKLFINTMLGQGQECFLEKSMQDNRKDSIVAKISQEVVDYYKQVNISLNNSEAKSCMGDSANKYWSKLISLKISYYSAITKFYMGSSSWEQEKYGEGVAFLASALDCYQEAVKACKSLKSDTRNQVEDALKYIADVIGGKYNSVKKDNEFVYHDKVPDKATLPEVKGASLVKALPFDPSNSAVTGPDIFSKLVPMEAHLAASSYSEEKAQLLRTVLADVEEKEIVLQQFKQAIELDPDKLIQVEEEDRLDSILVENCASLSVDQTPIKELTKAMKELSDRFMDIDSMLHDTRDLIEEEESQSQKIKDICGKTIESPEQVEDIKTELEMCQEVHSKAGTMNESLHIAMKIHISNLKIVSEGLDAVKKHCEIKKTMSLLNDNDYEDISLVKKLCSKVKEMEDQRQSLVNQLRSQLEEDDVTSALMTKHGMEAEELFKDELKKHDSMVEYIRLNLEAQEKILNGVTEVNVRYNKIRKVIDEHKQKVNLKTQQLLISCTEYKEAVRRCKDGTDFFKELLGKASEANEKMNKIHDKNTKLRKKLLEKFEANKAPPRPVAPKPKPTQAGAAVPQIPAIPGVGLSAAELSELSAGMDDDFNDPAFLRYLQMTGGLPGGGPLPSVPKVPNPTPATEARPQPRIPTLPPTARSVHQVIPVSQPHPTSNPTDMNPRNFATSSPQSSYQMPPLSNAQAHPQPYMGPSQRNVPPDGDYTSNPSAALSPAYSDPGVNLTDPPRARYASSQQQLPQRQPTSHPNMNYTSLSGAPKTAPSHQPHVEYTAAGQQQYGQVQTNQVPAYSLQQQQQQPHPSSFVVQPPTHVQQGTNIASDSRTNQQHQPVYSHHRHQHVPANYAQVPHNNQPQPSMSPQVQQNYAPLPPTSQYAQQTSGNITIAPHQVSNYNIAANNNPQNLYQQNQQQHQLPHQQNQQQHQNQQHQHQNPLHQQQNQLHQHQPQNQQHQNQQHQQQNQLHQQQHQQRASQFVQTPKLPQQAAVSLQSAFHQPNLPQTQSTFTGQPIAQDPRKNVQASNIAYQAEHLASNQNAKGYQPLPSQTQISRTQLQFPQQAQLHQQQQQQLPIQQMQQNQPRPLLSQPQIQQQQQKQFHPQIHQQQQQQQQFRPQIQQQQQQQQQQQFRPQIPPQHVNHPQQQPRQQILQPQHRQLQQPQGQQPQMQVLPNQTQHPVGLSNSYNNPQHAETRNAPLPDARPTYQNNVPKQNPPQGNIPVPRFSNPTAASAQPQRQMLSPTHVEAPYQTQQSATISPSPVYQQTSQALLPSSRPHQPQQAVHQPQQHPTAAHQQPHHNVKPPHTPSTNQATEAQLPQPLLQPTRAIAPQTNQRESGSSKVPGASVPIRPSADLAGLTYTPAETLRPTRASTSADELLSASPDNNIGEEVPAPKLMLVPEIVDSQEDAMVVRRYDGIPYKSEADLMQFKSDTEAFHQKVSSLLIKVPGALCQLDKDWKQLSELQEKHARSLSTAVGRCSSYKNRFQDILPFDQTRVVLGESKDDYINASLVDGISPYCPRFIATQSPLPSSISDFWTMIHEQQVTIIVMLVSKNVDTKKCAKYWPEDRNVSQRHGPISVTFTTSRFHDTYIERTFTLKHNKSSLPRSLTQLQYTAWPEHGLPASTRDLLSFMRVVGSFHTQQRNLQWPVVVHCEDGVSHSGTFCTSIACVQELDAGQGIPDILAVVETIRKRRKFMLQEKAQLKFVHDLVLKHAIDLLKERGVEIEVKSTQSNTPQQQVSVSPNHRHDGANFDVFGSGKLSTIRANVDKMTIRPNDKISAATPNTSKITESALAPSPGPAAPHSPAVLVDITTLIGSNVSDLVQGTIVGVDGSKQTHSAPVAISVRPDLVSSCNDNADEVKQVAAERGSVHQTDVAPTPALPPQQQGGQQMHLQSAEQPPSFLDKLTPESFTLGTEVKEKQRITKADFLKPRGLSLGVGQNSEQGDPFGDLDPLWGLKK